MATITNKATIDPDWALGTKNHFKCVDEILKSGKAHTFNYLGFAQTMPTAIKIKRIEQPNSADLFSQKSLLEKKFVVCVADNFFDRRVYSIYSLTAVNEFVQRKENGLLKGHNWYLMEVPENLESGDSNVTHSHQEDALIVLLNGF